MLESLVVWIIIAISAFFLGRRLWRQWRAATSGKGAMSCGCGCSCGGEAICPTKCEERQR